MHTFNYTSQPIVPEGHSKLKNSAGPECAFTIDVEDWYQSCIDFDADISERVSENVKKLLDCIDAHSIKGTFFVQGMVAEKFPALMQRLVADGHEIQSHGYSHRPLFNMNISELRTEIDNAKKSVEDACGVRVSAFRAPDFSIIEDNLWHLGVLAEAGFEVDSSIFPRKGSRYGIENWSTEPRKISVENGAKILEVPVAVVEKLGFRIPVAGGGYFRLFSNSVMRWAIRKIISEQRPVIIYCHPYEFNSEELAAYRGKAPTLFRLQQNIGRKNLARRFGELFEEFRFGRFDEVLETWHIS